MIIYYEEGILILTKNQPIIGQSQIDLIYKAPDNVRTIILWIIIFLTYPSVFIRIYYI